MLRVPRNITLTTPDQQLVEIRLRRLQLIAKSWRQDGMWTDDSIYRSMQDEITFCIDLWDEMMEEIRGMRHQHDEQAGE